MKILNFGSLNIDYVYNVKDFVKPEETIITEKMDQFPGGKGLNQSVAIAKAGEMVFHAGIIGKNSKILSDCLSDNNVDTSFLKKIDRPPGHAIIQVNRQGQNCIIVYGGTNKDITREYIDEVLNNFGSQDILVLQNEISNLLYLIDRAYEKKMNIILNPSPIDDEIFKIDFSKIRWIVINEVEGKAISGKEECKDMIKSLSNKYPNSGIVLTMGSDGVICWDKGKIYSHGIYDVEVVDTTAAGDTFTGYFVAGFAQGRPIAEILETASIASSIAVSRKGATNSIPTKEEVGNASLKLLD